MFCPECGFDLGEQDLNFCKNCGNPLKEEFSAPNRQTAGSSPPSPTPPLQQRDVLPPEPVLPQPHGKPQVSSKQQPQGDINYPSYYHQVSAEQHRQESNTRKRRRLLAILIPAVVLIIAAGIYLIFFSGLTGKKPTFNEQGNLFFKTRKKEYKERWLESKKPAGFKYNLFTDGTIEIATVPSQTYYPKSSINIPREIDGLLVTSIGDNAFISLLHLTEIKIPDSVTSIGELAFSGCYSLREITIPNSVTSIGNWAFAHCKSLTEITIPDSIMSIGQEVFYKCDLLTTAIVPYQLGYCGFEVFPEHTDIRDHSGQSRPLYAQEGDYTYALLNQPYTGLVDYQGNAKTVYIPEMIDGKKVVYLNNTFEFNDVITESIIPNSVTSIGDLTFNYCESLTEITIPDSVTSIGDEAFNYCESLTKITIPDSVTSVGVSAFYCCTSLTEIIIPDSVTNIGDEAFNNCFSLAKIHFTGTREQWQKLITDIYIDFDTNKVEFTFGK
ncbi:MAG: leucine-rich repeat protein [Clostridiaceae bacterium]|nr:leucine-rich repeat protein [Clostridiaceae bacterium]